MSPRADTASVGKALSTPGVHAVKPEWLVESAARYCQQSEENFSFGDRPVKTPEQPVDMTSAIHLAAKLIPQSLSDTDRLKAAIKFLLPFDCRERAEQLFIAFDAADVEEEAGSIDEQNAKEDVLTQLTQMVGADLLTAVLQALAIGHSEE